jgi:hypothetical protein
MQAELLRHITGGKNMSLNSRLATVDDETGMLVPVHEYDTVPGQYPS